MATYENIIVETQGRVGLIRLNRPAALNALCDALVQSEAFADDIEARVIAPLRAALSARRDRKAAEAAATRVDFYTMVRGEG